MKRTSNYLIHASRWIWLIGIIVLYVTTVVGVGYGGIDSSAIEEGKIIFAAHNTLDENAPLKLFVITPGEENPTQITTDEDFLNPDIEALPDGGWRIAYTTTDDADNTVIEVFDTITQTSVVVSSGVSIPYRPDFNADASFVVFQGLKESAPPPPPDGIVTGIDIWKAPADGSLSPVNLTDVSETENAEWPYFSPTEDRILYFATFGGHTRHIMSGDGVIDEEIPSPGGDTGSHLGFKSNGMEFVNAQNLTSYWIMNGAVGTLNDLKYSTTMMTQLAALGYEEVPISGVSGQGGQGTFGLSVDWSRDGSKLVFDALVQDINTK